MAFERYGHIAARSRLCDKLSPRNRLKTKAKIVGGFEGDDFDCAVRSERVYAGTFSAGLSTV
jgi:hypothetical protein